MDKLQIKQLIKEKVREMNEEIDPSKKEELSLRLQKLVQTYLEMSGKPTNRMIKTDGK